MIIGIVITLVVLLAGALVIAVARDPGPNATDVAMGYCHALARGDFDAVYRMTDPEVLQGRNRPQWIAARREAPRPTIGAAAVHVQSVAVAPDHVRAVMVLDDAGHTAVVELVRRQRIWVVVSLAPVPAPTAP